MGKRNNGHQSIDDLLGWNKTDSQSKRRQTVLTRCNGDCLWAAKELKRIANNYPDHEVRRKARVDSLHFYEKHKRTKHIRSKGNG